MTRTQTDTQALDPNYRICRAGDLDREVHHDPDSDCYLFPSENVFHNAAGELEMIGASKRLMSLLQQKEEVRIDLELFKQEKKPLAKI